MKRPGDGCGTAIKPQIYVGKSVEAGEMWVGEWPQAQEEPPGLQRARIAAGVAPGRLVGVGVGGADGRHHAGGGAGRDVERRPKLAVADAVCEVVYTCSRGQEQLPST